MKLFEVEIKGLTPLLQRKMSEDILMGLLQNRKGSKIKVEQDLSPREIAENHVYKNEIGQCVFPADYICGALGTVASDYKQKSSGSGKKTYKSVIKGVVRPTTHILPLLTDQATPIMDFEVDIRAGTNHNASGSAVAVVRPRFDKWRSSFQIEIDDTIISPDLVHQMLEDAGRRAGLGSYRVSKGGYFGKFSVTKFKELENKI